ncbi:hypothetical protein SteCoe_26792 [Stentor coeruleus]|uniref:Uncharacterized protein n=1 Tax=Stentor coeruleus TaxID=5963 RepID=A0A1R2BCE7_9CILI|nr:hypothetical protein SteCoe_26792 [Stentor coeruleus]
MKISDLERVLFKDARAKVDENTFNQIASIPLYIIENYSYYNELLNSIEDPILNQTLSDYITLCALKIICQQKLTNNYEYCLKSIYDLKDRYDVSELSEQFVYALHGSVNQENLNEIIDYAHHCELISSISGDKFKFILSFFHTIIYPKVLKAFYEKMDFFSLIIRLKKLNFDDNLRNRFDNIFFTYFNEALKFLINNGNNSLHLKKLIRFAKKCINEEKYAELKRIFDHSLYTKFLSISKDCSKKDQTIKSLKKPEDDGFEAVVVLSEKQTYFRYCFKENEKNKKKIIKEIDYIYDFITTLELSNFGDLFARLDNEYMYMSIEFPFKLHGIDKDLEIRAQENRHYTYEELKNLSLAIAKIGYEAEKLGQELKFYPSMFLVDQNLNVITFPKSIISRTYYKKFGAKYESEMQNQYKNEEGRVYEYCVLVFKISEVTILKEKEKEYFISLLQEIASNENTLNWKTALDLINRL